MKPALIFMSLLLGIVSLQAQDFSRLSPTSETQILGYIQTEMADENMVGVSVGIIKNGEIAYVGGHGFENQACNVPASANSLYRIASISKMFTSVAALQLMENGDLDLTENIRTYVPEYPVKPQGTITMEDLLSNESGIQHYGQVDPYNSVARDLYIKDHPDSYDPIAAIDIFKDQPILFTPGSQYNYTTWGFNLAAAVVERAGTSPFEAQVKNRIVDVADMPFFQPAYRSKMPFYHQADGYRNVNGTPQPDKGGSSDYNDVTYKLGGGGWICSARDLTHFMKAYIDGQLLTEPTVAMMGTNHDPGNGTNYGYGTLTAIRNGDTLLFHSGGQAWTSTLIYFSPENHNGVVIMTNNRNASCFPLARLLYDNISSYTLTNTVYSNPIPQSLDSPILDFPADMAQNTNTTILFKWSPVDYAQYYEYEVADNPNFNNPIRGKTKNAFAAVNNLSENQAHFWRIRAINESLYGGKMGNWTASNQFSTGNALGNTILPYTEGFERFHAPIYSTDSSFYSGVGFQWKFEPENEVGRANFGTWSITQKDGKGALTLDVLSTNGAISCTNYLTLSMDLSSYALSSDLELSFDYMHHGEEQNVQDRIWIRGSETDSWVEIYDWYANRTAAGIWKEVSMLDIDALLTANGQFPSQTFQLRIGQRDNSYASGPSSNDGVTFDNLSITGTPRGVAIDEEAFPTITIYPNPTERQLFINGLEKGNITLINSSGKILLQQEWNQQEIDVSSFSTGLYVVIIELNGKQLVRPFLKK